MKLSVACYCRFHNSAYSKNQLKTVHLSEPDVGGGYWRQNLLVISKRCWWPIWDVGHQQNDQITNVIKNDAIQNDKTEFWQWNFDGAIFSLKFCIDDTEIQTHDFRKLGTEDGQNENIGHWFGLEHSLILLHTDMDPDLTPYLHWVWVLILNSLRKEGAKYVNFYIMTRIIHQIDILA